MERATSVFGEESYQWPDPPEYAWEDAHALTGGARLREAAAGSSAIRSAAAEGRACAEPPADYSPYPVDWRFLPEALLLAKDMARELVVRSVMSAADVPVLRPLWRGLVGRSTMRSICAAGRLFIHIPKTGGTSISYCLYQRNLPHLTARFYRKIYGGSLAGIPSFSVLRDPVERLASCYRFLKHGGSSIVAVSRYDMARLGGLDTFDNFVAFLHEDPGRTRLAQALAPQTGFVCDETGKILVDRLFRMTPRGFPDDLAGWLGLDQLPKLNVSLEEPVTVSRKTVSRIEDIYSSDFGIFYGQTD